MINPPVLWVLEALNFVGNVQGDDVRPVAVEEESLEELHTEDPEDDEECAADEDNVAYRLQRGEKSLHHYKRNKNN